MPRCRYVTRGEFSSGRISSHMGLTIAADSRHLFFSLSRSLEIVCTDQQRRRCHRHQRKLVFTGFGRWKQFRGTSGSGLASYGYYLHETINVYARDSNANWSRYKVICNPGRKPAMRCQIWQLNATLIHQGVMCLIIPNHFWHVVFFLTSHNNSPI